MNINTGHLITNEALQSLQDYQREEYMSVPQKLETAARKKLAGKNEAMVSLTSDGKLSKWAKTQRSKNPANIASQEAKEQGLTYWEYMEKPFQDKEA